MERTTGKIQIKEFNRSTIDLVRAAITEAVSSIEQKYNMSVTVGNIGYRSFECGARLEIKLISKEANVQSKEDGSSKCEYLGLPKDCIGKEFTSKGTIYEIDSINTRARVYPVVVIKKSTGQKYKFKVNAILKHLKE